MFWLWSWQAQLPTLSDISELETMKYVYDLATLHTFSSFFANEEILTERNSFTTIRYHQA